MKTLECARAEKFIIEDLDEGLDVDRKNWLEHHIAACESCARIQAETQLLFHTAGLCNPPIPGSEFWDSYESTLEARIREKEFLNRSSYNWKIAGTFLAAAISFFAVFCFIPDRGRYAIDDPQQATILMEELDMAMGPLSQETLPFQAQDLTIEVRGLRQDDIAVSWFEVEEEHG
ncbi:hypothetical protein [Desulfomonile tiedjei]|uniref:Zinc-finger domain-containing protein n=1 Tax=Desulfomonile tiedjei (strain ATCC 49306 / DSM 6799 / DCB-1) TaxID=706587 RepID=I4C435_DESTA|nr:hypothetical protein [Desulfomonile tiedjei]AFM24326.1 hypothetical protein Desti_1615 [Desulfomonile tiedjei DSM 6799]